VLFKFGFDFFQTFYMSGVFYYFLGIFKENSGVFLHNRVTTLVATQTKVAKGEKTGRAEALQN